jgi:hypothetical protein
VDDDLCGPGRALHNWPMTQADRLSTREAREYCFTISGDLGERMMYLSKARTLLNWQPTPALYSHVQTEERAL